MKTTFVSPSKDLQNLVLEYFRSFDREVEILPKSDIPGAIDIVLRGTLAARFETIASPKPGEIGARMLRLIFDRELAAIAPGYELVAPRSHVIRLIQNDLAERARFTRSAALFNIDEAFSDLRELGVSIHHAIPEVSVRYLARRFYVVRYLLSQSAYERVEDTLGVVVDASSGKVLPHDTAAKLTQINLADLDTVFYRKVLLQLEAPNRDELFRVFQLAEEAAKQRVTNVLRERAIEIEGQLQQECDRVRQYYEAELRDASLARRQNLEQARDREIQELQNRYQVRSELKLVSLQEIIVPIVEYSLLVRSSHGLVRLPKVFNFDPLSNTVMTDPCEHCGQDAVWAYCTLGNHLECGKCGTVKKCSHSECDKGMCTQHMVRCEQCSQIICEDHSRTCQYCQTDRRYCKEHIISSFENRDICPQCAHFCAGCGQAFPLRLSTSCVVCSRDFCVTHSRTCPSCGKHYCREHGVTPRNHAEEYCHNCVDACKFCTAQAFYLKSDLKYCAECGLSLCGNHTRNCISCGKLICDSHTLITTQGPGCTTCFGTCQTCGVLVHRSRLMHCHVCPPTEQGLHCRSHVQICSVCGQWMCQAHQVELYDGRWACAACSGSCRACERFFPDADLRVCSACHDHFCFEHAVQSQFRDEAYCIPHANFVSCGGCDRQGPIPQLKNCTLCGMSYCPHCVSQDKDTCCNYCRNRCPIVNQNDLTGWYQAVTKATLPDLADAQRRTILNALAGQDKFFEFYISESARYLILYATWRVNLFNIVQWLFRQVVKFVVVRDKREDHIYVRVNP